MLFGNEHHLSPLNLLFGPSSPPARLLSFSSERAHSSQFPTPGRRNGTDCRPHSALRRGPPACRNTSFRGPLHTSVISPSSLRRTLPDDPAAPCASWPARPLEFHPQVGPRHRSSVPHPCCAIARLHRNSRAPARWGP